MNINEKTILKIVVISITTSVALIAAVLLFVFCSKTNNMSSISYSYGIMLVTYIVVIYSFAISRNQIEEIDETDDCP